MAEEHFLRKNLAAHIAKVEGCFKFRVLPQSNEASMPVDKAMVPWSVDPKEFVHVATLILPAGQLIDGEKAKRACDQLSMTGWHSLPEHEPLGSINYARGFAYKQMADARRKHNKMPLKEPKSIEEWQ